MPVYLGSLGRMVKLPYVGSQQVQAEERYNFTSTLEGKRKALVKPRGPRTWALSADHFRPNEHSLLSQFANGAWGPGPFAFVPADAPHTNLLTPAVSMCDPSENYEASVTPAGPMVTPDGVAPRSYLNNGSGVIIFGRDRNPVIQGVPVTGAAYVLGDKARVRLNWYRADGSLLSQTNSTMMSTLGVVQRIHVTAVPPAEAAGCIVSVVNGLQACMPSMTWGAELMPWSDGQGCARSVVHGLSRSQVLAVPGHTYSNVSFTITEVG